jgi:3,4-dihydroxy 2-butanone 4-phosphate synthase / GTP cyclohydrolase II
MVILVDDEDRENEGDLCMAADKVTPEAINFMATYGRGLICLTLTDDTIRRLDLPMMVQRNQSTFQTGFTVSIEAREGVSTGISAKDRALTILTAVSPQTHADDIVSPGHVFPIRARRGGVLVRTGQTEGSVDLATLAGCDASGVICEIMNPDGSMARRPELEDFSRQHKLRIVTIAELIEYRLAHESLVEVMGERRLNHPLWGDHRVVVFRSMVDDQEHIAIVKGILSPERPCLVRVQAVDLPRDLLGLTLFQGGAELQAALAKIVGEGEGVFIYLVRSRPDGRLSDKLAELDGVGSPNAEDRVGSRMDLREFGVGAQILKALGVRSFRLLSNHHARIVGLDGFGLELVERVSLPLSTGWGDSRGEREET